MSKPLTVSTLAQALIAALQPFTVEGSGSTAINQIADTVADTVAKAGTTVEAGDTVTSDVWALSTCGEYFIPFTDEIHGMTKDDDGADIPKITGKGLFAKKRGVNPSVFNKAEGNWIDEHGKEANQFELVDGQPVEIEGTKPGKPTPPAKPGKPTPPSKPGKPTPPAKKQGEDYQAKALAEINSLTNTHNVDYDFLVDQLLTPFEVESFNDLDESDHKAVWTEAKAWNDWLNQIVEVRSQCEKWDAEHGDGLVEGFDLTVGELGYESTAEIITGAHSAVLEAVEEYAKPWAEYYAG
ncbi:hypothetical protein NVP1072O_31 [Vibrio phage 1.072.O._10N.286.48.A12]|nr:hypothetical protein NVP1004O_30 [Vibrio phage 1.004.O._10N.261.54.A2]AUR83590.1 hypothetical protein NVP1037O_30 [Vibrio phage 1.037.O._10N.261.52.F7]AUR84475.1 hypothetical protein NVP1056O_33 [Vibrio phage 1.056.O._10N.261.48.C11]AUR84992.1 hypothetical protein NVP1066O_33 [Vibrio phage 1.066.O._10N.286.46.E8]AUR85123.1 hypothetical protein NVP1068O_33 [Vibrio phage 1.068.O._10N.261.51.F8]AUR85348.1 hypothetical protein NVP1072O_31 [Vibrio phage 1.072.O._10N.286.48.A12]